MRGRPALNRACGLEGCENKHLARGYCRKHYYRFVVHGDPLGGLTEAGKPLRFVEETARLYQGDDCLVWPYAMNDKGYGRLNIHGKDFLAHRAVCERVHGPPVGLRNEAAHSCGNGHMGCVNPNHLSWKTRAENKADELVHGTRARGERSGLSKLTEAQVLKIRSLKGSASQREIGRMFGVAQGRISEIFRMKAWAWLPDNNQLEWKDAAE